MQYHLGHGLHTELIQPATAGTTRRMNTVAMTPLPRLLDGNRNCAAMERAVLPRKAQQHIPLPREAAVEREAMQPLPLPRDG